MTELLVSTTSALVRVSFDWSISRLETTVVESGFGVYFGLTRCADRIFAVSRNLDLQAKLIDSQRPTNAILELDPTDCRILGPAWSLAEFRDLHQIRFKDDWLWLVNGQDPELLAVDPICRQVVGSISLSGLVPTEHRHDDNPDHPLDRYHFNSLHFQNDRLWLLAHNWNFGAFALEMDYTDRQRFLDQPRIVSVRPHLGLFNHDIFPSNGWLTSLDSAHSTVRCGDFHLPLPRGSNDVGRFPRGLAVGRTHFFVGSGDISVEREQRASGNSCLSMIERSSGRIVADFIFGQFGNVCDVLLLSEPDETDSPTTLDTDNRLMVRALTETLHTAKADFNVLQEKMRQTVLEADRYRGESLGYQHELRTAEEQLRPLIGLDRFAVEVAWMIQRMLNRLPFLMRIGKRIRGCFSRKRRSPPALPASSSTKTTEE